MSSLFGKDGHLTKLAIGHAPAAETFVMFGYSAFHRINDAMRSVAKYQWRGGFAELIQSFPHEFDLSVCRAAGAGGCIGILQLINDKIVKNRSSTLDEYGDQMYLTDSEFYSTMLTGAIHNNNIQAMHFATEHASTDIGSFMTIGWVPHIHTTRLLMRWHCNFAYGVINAAQFGHIRVLKIIKQERDPVITEHLLHAISTIDGKRHGHTACMKFLRKWLAELNTKKSEI